MRFLDPIITLFKVAFHHATLSGDFYKCDRKNFSDAGVEFFVALLFSTMPLWLFPIFSPLIFQADMPGISSYIKGGELFIYAAALMGPLIYIIAKRYGEFEKDSKFKLSISFPHGMTFVVMAMLICVFSGLFIGIIRSPLVQSYSNKLNMGGIFWASILTYSMSLYIVFTASVYRNALEDHVRRGGQSREADEFASEFKEARDAT